MSVPVLDPKAWCLLYFRIPGSDVLPIIPDEFFTGEGSSVNLSLLSQAPGIQQEWVARNPQELYEALKQALVHPIYTCSGKLFTVHKTGLLERLQNWQRLADKMDPSPGVPAPAWALPTVDLVEEFHRPAILTYQQRRDFSAKVINFWLGGPTTSTQDTLWRLCHIL
jgi:hypothetical protein